MAKKYVPYYQCVTSNTEVCRNKRLLIHEKNAEAVINSQIARDERIASLLQTGEEIVARREAIGAHAGNQLITDLFAELASSERAVHIEPQCHGRTILDNCSARIEFVVDSMGPALERRTFA